MTSAPDVDRAIRASGLRRTMPRGIVAEALSRRPGHHTVGEIYEIVRQDYPAAGIARSSIYRALEALERAGLVVSVRVGQEEARFEWDAPEHEHDVAHHHLICDDCGHMSEVALAAAGDVEEEARRRYGFATQVRHLALRGRCRDCATAGTNETNGETR